MYQSYVAFTGSAILAAPTLFIVVGSFIFITAFLGCCGAIRESYGKLIAYSVIMCLIFILELAAGIAGYAFRQQVRTEIAINARSTMNSYGAETDAGLAATEIWDDVQAKFKCCGVNGPKDWKDQLHLKPGAVPDSCCKRESRGDHCGAAALYMLAAPNNTQKIYQIGCVDDFAKWVEHHVYTIAGVGVGFAFFQLIGIIFSCLLAHNSPKTNYESI
jgi:hypothetical protein